MSPFTTPTLTRQTVIQIQAQGSATIRCIFDPPIPAGTKLTFTAEPDTGTWDLDGNDSRIDVWGWDTVGCPPSGQPYRYAAFSEEERRILAGALHDSQSTRSSVEWYQQCARLHAELVMGDTPCPPGGQEGA